MKIHFKWLYNFFLIIFITLLYTIIIEVVARVSVSLINENKNYFFYGFNKNLNIEIVDLSEFKFNLNNLNNHNKKSKKIIKDNLSKSKKIIWIFGASMTYGFSCGDSSSSWPNELKKIDDSIEVINYGFPSIYSDDSIKILDYELRKQSKSPDYIFWAHRDEEVLSIIRGIGRNKYKINENISKNNLSKINYIFMRLKKTFEANFISYLILDHTVKKIKKRNNFFPERKIKGFDQKEYTLASLNFELNTNDAIQIAEQENIKFFIISLFSDDQFLKKNEKKFNYYYNEKINKIKKNKNITYIDTFALLLPDDKKNYKKFTCENKHYTLMGNKKIAELLYNNLNSN